VQVFDNFVLYLGHEHESFSTATNKKKEEKTSQKSQATFEPVLRLGAFWGTGGSSSSWP